MDPTLFQRRVRWAIRGALTLALLGIFFGTMFIVLITIAAGDVPDNAGAGFWIRLLLLNGLLWGVGALPFGAALGMFASMIWRDETALQVHHSGDEPERRA
jgi:hypothetical protein